MLQFFDASFSRFIDLCNVVYHKVMAENMMRLAQDILNTRVLQILRTTAQQVAIDNYISSFKPQWCIVCITIVPNARGPYRQSCFQFVGGSMMNFSM
jgi:hypothetical protein